MPKAIKKLKNLKVVKGAGRGRKIGIPTVNFDPSQAKDLADGIYLSKIYLTKPHWSLLHFGPRPTFGEEEKSLEVYILDFDGQKELNGTFTVEIYDLLRQVLKFKSSKEMVEKIQDDIQRAKGLISNYSH